MAISKEVLQELMKEYKSPEDLLGEEGILKELTKALVLCSGFQNPQDSSTSLIERANHGFAA